MRKGVERLTTVKCPHCDVNIIVTKDYDRNWKAIMDHAMEEHPEIINPILEKIGKEKLGL